MVYLKWNGSCSQGSFENITVVISTMETEISTFTLGFNWTHSKVTFSQCDKVWYLWHLYVSGMVDGSSIDTGDTGDSVRQSYTGDLWILLAWHESECLKHLQKCYIQRILWMSGVVLITWLSALKKGLSMIVIAFTVLAKTYTWNWLTALICG